jgi:hypothetical protein
MQSLDLYKKRRYTSVKLSDGIEYKIPNEYTVEEVERLLELKAKEEEIKAISVEEGTPEAEANLVLFWNNIFAQLEIIFQSFQPELNESYLRKHLTHNEALEIIGFFQEYRALTIKKITAEQPEEADSKKKLRK